MPRTWTIIGSLGLLLAVDLTQAQDAEQTAQASVGDPVAETATPPSQGEPPSTDAASSRTPIDDPGPSDAGSPARPEPTGPFFGIGLRGGVSINSDQLVAGPHLAVRELGVPFLDLNLSVLVGLGSEYVSVRPALHAAAVATVGSWRFFCLAGLSLFVFEPRGDFADFCDKTGIDCDSVTVGPEAGLGVGFGPVAIEAVVGFGELPVLTLLGEITWMP